MVSKVEPKSERESDAAGHSDPERRADVMGMVSDFSKETSLHGMKFVLHGCTTMPRRLFWAAIIVIQIGSLVFMLVNLLSHVYDRPVLTKVITRYVTQLDFPAVTVCSDVVGGEQNSLSDFQRDVLDNLHWRNTTYFESLSPEKYKEINLPKIYKRWLLSADLGVETCVFGQINCSEYVDMVWGKQALCYTINSVLPEDGPGFHDNKSSSPRTENKRKRLVSNVPGAESGLRLTVKLSSPLDGIKVTLHEPDEKISLTNSEFLQLAPGTKNYIGVKVRKNKFLPAPCQAFGDRECQVTSGDIRHPLVTRGRYTLRACQDACYLKSLEELCGCTIDFDREIDACGPLVMIRCFYSGQDRGVNNSPNSHTDNGGSCDCPVPCDDLVYDTTLSSAPYIGPETDGLPKKNDLRIAMNIHFDRLRIESTEQVEDYTKEDVFASVGGQMGLFLGASIITLIEIGELLVRCAYRWVVRNFNSTPNSVSNSASPGH